MRHFTSFYLTIISPGSPSGNKSIAQPTIQSNTDNGGPRLFELRSRTTKVSFKHLLLLISLLNFIILFTKGCSLCRSFLVWNRALILYFLRPISWLLVTSRCKQMFQRFQKVRIWNPLVFLSIGLWSNVDFKEVRYSF